MMPEIFQLAHLRPMVDCPQVTVWDINTYGLESYKNDTVADLTGVAVQDIQIAKTVYGFLTAYS